MMVMGLSVFSDASAAVVRGGEIVCAVEEERLNRIKHYEGFPWLSVDECLRIAGIQLRDLDAVAIGWNPYLGWGKRISVSLRDSLRNPDLLRTKVNRGGNYLNGIRDIFRLRQSFRQRYGGRIPPVYHVSHHTAHAASSYFVSPFDTARIVVADGVGESATFSIFSGASNAVTRRAMICYPHSLGHLYASVTAFLGFRPTSDEGKVMALASYGEDEHHDLFSSLCRTVRQGDAFRLNTGLLDYHEARMGHFREEWLRQTSMQPRRQNESLDQRHENLACSLQACVERTVLSLLRHDIGMHGNGPLCAAGGVFLNSVLNGRLVRELAPEVFIQPAAGDNGVSIGAALQIASRIDPGFRREAMRHAFLGSEYADAEMRRAIENAGLPYVCPEDIAPLIADEIIAGNVVARFCGRMEFGPRALGNRSILASACHPDMKDILNRKVKHRESFRPFAAAVLLEDVAKYFDSGKESPYMLKVFHFAPAYRDMFPAVRHVDGSCRVQTVTKEENPQLHAVLVALKERTGHGIVLNTSLNIAGEPIVRTPGEAIRLFRSTEVDTLAMGPFVLRKSEGRI